MFFYFIKTFFNKPNRFFLRIVVLMKVFQYLCMSFINLVYFFYFLQTAVLTVLLVPIRALGICFFLLLAWLLAYVSLYGYSRQDLKMKPFSGWRRSVTLHIFHWFMGHFSFIKSIVSITHVQLL